MYGQPIAISNHMASDLYALGDRYAIHALRVAAEKYLERTVTVRTVWSRLVLARQYIGLRALREKAVRFCAEHFEACVASETYDVPYLSAM